MYFFILIRKAPETNFFKISSIVFNELQCAFIDLY